MKKYGLYIFLAIFCLFFRGPDTAEAGKIFFVYDDWVPLEYFDDTGRGRGLLVDIAREVFEKELGLSLICVKRPWKRAQEEVRKGISDFMITVATPVRKTYAVASRAPFYSLPLHVYTYAGHGRMNAIQKIRSARDILKLGLRPVSNLGNGWHKENIDNMGIHTHYVGTDKNVLLFLANKRADIMIDGLITTNCLIRQMGLTRKILLIRPRFSQVDLHLLISRNSIYASWMPRIEQVFKTIQKSGKLQAIASGYPGCGP